MELENLSNSESFPTITKEIVISIERILGSLGWNGNPHFFFTRQPVDGFAQGEEIFVNLFPLLTDPFLLKHHTRTVFLLGLLCHEVAHALSPTGHDAKHGYLTQVLMQRVLVSEGVGLFPLKEPPLEFNKNTTTTTSSQPPSSKRKHEALCMETGEWGLPRLITENHLAPSYLSERSPIIYYSIFPIPCSSDKMVLREIVKYSQYKVFVVGLILNILIHFMIVLDRGRANQGIRVNIRFPSQSRRCNSQVQQLPSRSSAPPLWEPSHLSNWSIDTLVHVHVLDREQMDGQVQDWILSCS